MSKKAKAKNSLPNADVGLGELEASVMNIVWKQKRATVKDVFIELYPKRRLAYTTIMTVMRRLAEKGILEQDRSSKTYYYTPRIDQDKMALGILESVLDKVVGDSTVDLIIDVIKNNTLSEEELVAFESELTKATG